MIRKLTAIAVKNAKHKPDGKAKTYPDGGGLSLQVSTTGKYWRYNFRFEGKQKTLSIGLYPDLSLDDARTLHLEARQLLVKGIDPASHKQEVKKQKQAVSRDSFQNIAMEWFKKFSFDWSDNYKNKTIRLLENELYPIIGKASIDSVEPADVLEACKRLTDEGKLHSAHKTKQIAGQVFRYGIATGKCKRDPAADLRGAIPPAKETSLPTLTKPSEIGGLLRAMSGYEGEFIVKQALNLLPLLMCRTGELRRMEWSELDLDSCVWTIPANKMKSKREHRVPLTKQAIELIESVRQITGSKQYVFHSLRSKSGILSENTINAALRTLGYGKDQIVSHGFRSMASTLLNEQNWNPDAIETQLAHLQGDKTRAAYNRSKYWDERVRMMQHYSSYLDSLRDGASVIPINRHQA